VRVAFRADASLVIGTGHVMRCLTLADALRERGAECFFLSRDHSANLHEVVEARGHSILSLGGIDDEVNQDFSPIGYSHWLGVDLQRDIDDTRLKLAGLNMDWLIVDHYALDAQWEESIRPFCSRIMVIDDLADRNHSADLLLDQNLGAVASQYESRVPKKCVLILGPYYALLRQEFAKLRNQSLLRRSGGNLNRLLITMGGVDREDVTSSVLDALALCDFSKAFLVTVVMGASAPWRAKVMTKAEKLPFPTIVLENVYNMSALMCDADLAIGGAGSTAWERCCLGLPSLNIVLAENQRRIANALNYTGAGCSLERSNLVADLMQMMRSLAHDRMRLVRMSEAAAKVTDGQGAERVVQYIYQGCLV
jgi:UDP-2,4-diacetamido-2,4,6-trideoxy-beta-L-altropyranose hydrolase